MHDELVTLSTEKINGRFYTPEFIVNNILDLSGYHGQSILKKHVIDNSCGDGAFLIVIVDRYCNEFLKLNNDLRILSEELSEYIHGIEIDENESKMCIENLNNIIRKYGLNRVNWDINCTDTLTVDRYNGKMDFVLGNPPYVRVHNLGRSFDNIKKFSFAQNGMTDLYIVFYEIGLRMLNENGVLGYITPSSFFNSVAGEYMRLHLVNNNLLDKIVNLKHFQAFTATTYTAITILRNNRQKNTTDYYQFEDKNNFPFYVDTLSIEDYFINGNFYFANKRKLDELKTILNYNTVKNFFAVKNGFATLADKFFISNFDFGVFTIPIIKASTGKQYKCLFPYSKGKLVPFEDLTTNSSIKSHFEDNKELLLRRSLEKNSEWYGFGRTQGINDVYRCKYSINTLIKTQSDLKLIKCDKGVGVYSGLYIVTDVSESELKEMLYSEDFVSYISLLGKYKNGGYYTFSSKDLKNYLEYKYSQRNGFKMNNSQFLATLKNSFIKYLETGSRSNKKLGILHGAIAEDLQERLNDSNYSVYSLGYGIEKEHKINGRYVDKTVDITIEENNIPVAGIAIKYVMSNYSQNSNNYFENMLGETANIRCAKIPYFQIFIIPDKIPYFDKYGDISKWETINARNLNKYIKLSNDNIDTYLHTPNKTLVFIVHIQDKITNAKISNRQNYVDYYSNYDFDMTISALNFEFGNTIVYNDYDKFIQKVVYTIKSL